MMDGQRFCLRWDGFRESVSTLLDDLRADGELLDVTLCCDGSQVRAHRLVLAMCSPYFRQVLKTHPCDKLVLFLRDTPAADLAALVEFMYRGAVDVRQSQLASFIKTAEMLQIRGLSGDDDKSSPATPASPAPISSPASKRRRTTPDPGGSTVGSGFGPSAGSGSGSVQRSNSVTDSIASRSPVRTTATPPRVSQLSRTDSGDYSRDYARPAASTSQQVKSEQDNNYPTPEYAQSDQPDQRDDSVDWNIDDVTGSSQRQPKQEPIDLTEDDEVDAALGCVAAIEAGYDTAGPPPPPLTRGSATGTAPQRFNLQGNAVPVSSPRLTSAPMASPAGWDVSGNGKGSAASTGATGRGSGSRRQAGGGSGRVEFRCNECGKVFNNSSSLKYHTRWHLGRTACAICGKYSNTMSDLLIHLRSVHKLSQDEAHRLIPQTEVGRRYLADIGATVGPATAVVSAVDVVGSAARGGPATTLVDPGAVGSATAMGSAPVGPATAAVVGETSATVGSVGRREAGQEHNSSPAGASDAFNTANNGPSPASGAKTIVVVRRVRPKAAQQPTTH